MASVEIPFVGGAYEGRSKSINAQQSINMFPAIDKNDSKAVIAMYNTPGLVEFCDTGTSAIVRGMAIQGASLFAVVGNTVYEIDSAGSATSLGTITTSTGHVGLVSNGSQLLIVDGTPTGYYVESSTLTEITDADFPQATDCVFFDGYFIVTVYGTGKIQISQLYNAAVWDALDFATAEASPDTLVGIGTTRQNIWLFGDSTVEVYYNSGNPDFPFERVPGSTIDIGCGSLTSVVEIEGVLYWLSNKKTIVRGEGQGFGSISPPTIAYQISTYSTVDDATAYTYSLEGRTFYVISFPTEEKTWVYDITTNFWHEWSSES